MAILIIIIYCSALLFIFLFSIGQFQLARIYIHQQRSNNTEPEIELSVFPMVTIQLPVYNEKYVVERLLDAVSKIDYPKDKIEIQVLDDSTDETTTIIQKKIGSLKEKGINNINLIHRVNRSGFKAGALANGMKEAHGDFIAIFDADFLPTKDFLFSTLPYFNNPSIGVVQTRWGHLNEDYSLLTRLQAFGLDAHFTVEQVGRSAVGSFINFNGTCGVWRKQCITDAGGWSDDTLTEDLDLSYRAQLKGWKFIYRENLVTPGELPVVMPAIKSQQYRWNKGAAETARKNLIKVLGSRLTVKQKFHAFFHLLNSSVFIALLISAILSVPVLYIIKSSAHLKWLFDLGFVFVFGLLSITYFYWVAQKKLNPDLSLIKFLTLYCRYLIVSMGLSWHNGLAVLEGYLGRKTPFIRTPKFNIEHQHTWRANAYLKIPLSINLFVELFLCLYFLAGIIMGIMFHEFGLLIFHLMLVIGFASVFYFSIRPYFYVSK